MGFFTDLKTSDGRAVQPFQHHQHPLIALGEPLIGAPSPAGCLGVAGVQDSDGLRTFFSVGLGT